MAVGTSQGQLWARVEDISLTEKDNSGSGRPSATTANIKRSKSTALLIMGDTSVTSLHPMCQRPSRAEAEAEAKAEAARGRRRRTSCVHYFSLSHSLSPTRQWPALVHNSLRRSLSRNTSIAARVLGDPD